MTLLQVLLDIFGAGEHLCGMYSKFIDKPFLTIPKIIESDVILLITISYVTRLKFLRPVLLKVEYWDWYLPLISCLVVCPSLVPLSKGVKLFAWKGFVVFCKCA